MSSSININIINQPFTTSDDDATEVQYAGWYRSEWTCHNKHGWINENNLFTVTINNSMTEWKHVTTTMDEQQQQQQQKHDTKFRQKYDVKKINHTQPDTRSKTLRRHEGITTPYREGGRRKTASSTSTAAGWWRKHERITHKLDDTQFRWKYDGITTATGYYNRYTIRTHKKTA